MWHRFNFLVISLISTYRILLKQHFPRCCQCGLSHLIDPLHWILESKLQGVSTSNRDLNVLTIVCRYPQRQNCITPPSASVLPMTKPDINALVSQFIMIPCHINHNLALWAPLNKKINIVNVLHIFFYFCSFWQGASMHFEPPSPLEVVVLSIKEYAHCTDNVRHKWAHRLWRC